MRIEAPKTSPPLQRHSLPEALARRVTALREWIFTRVNGPAALQVPNESQDASRFLELFTHPAMQGRSRGAPLSDLFWYWMSPGAHLHQENVENGPEYQAIAATTLKIVSRPTRELEALLVKYADEVFPPGAFPEPTFQRTRAPLLRLWAGYFHELVFGEAPTEEERALIVAQVTNTIGAMKFTCLRRMQDRNRLLALIENKIRADRLPFSFEGRLSVEDQAGYLQSMFFVTGIVQMTDAMGHVLMRLGESPEWASYLRKGPAHAIFHFIDEVLRLYPLFGVSHRVTQDDIEAEGIGKIPKGTVVLFNHLRFHRLGFEKPETFDPTRWETLIKKETNYIPFGHPANRPCPAKGLAMVTMRKLTELLLARFEVFAAGNHSRQLPNGGPCLFAPAGTPRSAVEARLRELGRKDAWEEAWIAGRQLFFGSYMVWDARRKAMAQKYFERRDGSAEAGCPFSKATGKERTGE